MHGGSCPLLAAPALTSTFPRPPAALRAEKLLDFDEWCSFIRLTQLVDAQFSQQAALGYSSMALTADAIDCSLIACRSTPHLQRLSVALVA